MAPGGEAFIIFNFPPGFLFLQRTRSVICCAQGEMACVAHMSVLDVPAAAALPSP